MVLQFAQPWCDGAARLQPLAEMNEIDREESTGKGAAVDIGAQMPAGFTAFKIV